METQKIVILQNDSNNENSKLAGSPVGTNPQRKQPVTEATQAVFKNCAPFKDCRTN